jgi:hypothetical protein
MHAAEAADIAAAREATSYNVHLRRSPTSKINEPAATLAEAIEIADRMVSASGRSPLIYGITHDGRTVLIPKVVIEEARASAAGNDAPLTDDEVPAFLKTGLASMAASVEAGEVIAAPEAAAPEKPAKARKPKAGRDAGPANAADTPPVAMGKRASAEAAARAGELPAAPDFSANTHKAYRKHLEAMIELAAAGDPDTMLAYPTKDYDSSWKAINRYRDLCLLAIRAKAGQAAQSA